MYQKVLVPLDGSRDSERVIGSLEDVLDARSEVILLKVISPMSELRFGPMMFTANQREDLERTKE